MFYLIATYWPWMLVALALGAFIGWSMLERPAGWSGLVVGLFLVGLLVALLKWIPGVWGHRLETLLLLFVSYMLGAMLSVWARQNFGAKAAAPATGMAATGSSSTGMAAKSAAALAATSISAATASKPPTTPAPLAPVAATSAAGTQISAPAKTVAVAAPVAATMAAATPTVPNPGSRPATLSAAIGGKGDDLKLIKGIGPKNEAILHALGIWNFSQIASWSAPEQLWVGHHMAFPGRVEREHWVDQAKLLGAGIDTDHSRGVKSGAIPVDASADAPMSDADVQKLTSGMPETAAAVAGEDKFEGSRPLGLVAARGGKADDLKRIRGIGPQNEARLHGLGIWHFEQIASWTAEQVKWVGGYMAFPGRIDRENWLAQAKTLASGKETEFSVRVEKGLVASSRDDSLRGMTNDAKLPDHGGKS